MVKDLQGLTGTPIQSEIHMVALFDLLRTNGYTWYTQKSISKYKLWSKLDTANIKKNASLAKKVSAQLRLWYRSTPIKDFDFVWNTQDKKMAIIKLRDNYTNYINLKTVTSNYQEYI